MRATVFFSDRNATSSGRWSSNLYLNAAQGRNGRQLGNGAAQALSQIGGRLRP
jgi:hypothetical protein